VVTEYDGDELPLVLEACERMEAHLTAAVVSNDVLFLNKVVWLACVLLHYSKAPGLPLLACSRIGEPALIPLHAPVPSARYSLHIATSWHGILAQNFDLCATFTLWVSLCLAGASAFGLVSGFVSSPPPS
jgi:hypothetical protein